MGEILGLGLSHHPGFLGKDENMADILRRNLERPDVPDDWKDRENWPEAMLKEYGHDGGTAAAALHREAFVRNVRKLRGAIDDFKPDFLVIFGDDQYENFREDVVPSFCVYAYDDIEMQPYMPRLREGSPAPAVLPPPTNPWGEPTDYVLKIKTKRDAAKYLARGLIQEKVDAAYSYQPLHYQGLSHAFHRMPLYLDYDRKGFEYPIVPVAVNCYGSRVLVNRGGSYPVGRVDVPEGELDPPGPTPERCMEVGAAVARVLQRSPWRTAMIASSSWSHAFLVPKHYFMYPDIEADRSVYEQIAAGDFDGLRKRTIDEIEASGQQEVLNWFCLAGAMEELGRSKPDHSEFVQTHIFNSNKVFALYNP